ncbi:MAG TPA: two-component system response regulator KdpE [Casimicrobium sp.]|jgi:two-component system KDP operon response regulator KdpE|nr:two-component system response regulator KdpE [Casimicrobium sp.]
MNASLATLLVVEDDAQIRRFVRQSLEREGFRVREAEAYATGLIDAGTIKPDVVILDLGLPDGDGKNFVRELRGWSQVPVLILSARSMETDKIEVLDAGADDYLTKPFSVGELLARVRALLRRGSRSPDSENAVVQFGEVTVDMTRRLVLRAGVPVHLTAIEYRLLVALIANANKVVTQRQLLRDVWGPSHVESSHYLRIYVSHLRQKLEINPTLPQHLLTEIGVGYRFTM